MPPPPPLPPVLQAAEDDDWIDVTFSLDVRCTSDDTMDVTSDDLQLDPAHPGLLFFISG